MKKFCWTDKYIRLREGEDSSLIVPKRQSCSVISSIENQALQKSVFDYYGGNLVGIQLNMEDRDFII